tara:strand:- start:443 stop:985 length:543 start_codon:yes stop_codon:yes gene_type:complete
MNKNSNRHSQCKIISFTFIFYLAFTGCLNLRPLPRYTHSSSTAIVEELKHRVHNGHKRLEEVVRSYLGVPYKWGGVTREGMDCSAFVRATFRKTYGIELPRTSKQMYQLGDKVGKEKNLKPGDLVFFKNTYSGNGISHVGIYLGRGEFAHASSSRGVTITPMSNPYFVKRYAGSKRVAGT